MLRVSNHGCTGSNEDVALTRSRSIPNHHNRSLRIDVERAYVRFMNSQLVMSQGRRAIANVQPNDLGRRAIAKTKLIKIIVFRDNYELMKCGMVIDGLVVRTLQTQQAHMT